MQAAREFVQMLREEGIAASQVWGDADGLGTVMIDAMAELGYRINRFYGGQAASQPDEYANLIGELWLTGTMGTERERVNFGVLDPTTFKQITTRNSEWSEAGKLRVESKDKMRPEERKSPDRGDAPLGCIVCGSRLSGAVRAADVSVDRHDRNLFATGVTVWF